MKDEQLRDRSTGQSKNRKTKGKENVIQLNYIKNDEIRHIQDIGMVKDNFVRWMMNDYDGGLW